MCLSSLVGDGRDRRTVALAGALRRDVTHPGPDRRRLVGQWRLTQDSSGFRPSRTARYRWTMSGRFVIAAALKLAGNAVFVKKPS